jgi:hypothetical protein
LKVGAGKSWFEWPCISRPKERRAVACSVCPPEMKRHVTRAVVALEISQTIHFSGQAPVSAAHCGQHRHGLQAGASDAAIHARFATVSVGIHLYLLVLCDTGFQYRYVGGPSCSSSTAAEPMESEKKAMLELRRHHLLIM